MLLQEQSSPKKPKIKAPPVKTKKKGLSYKSHHRSCIKRAQLGYFIQFQHLYQTITEYLQTVEKRRIKINMKKPVSWLSCGVQDRES